MQSQVMVLFSTTRGWEAKERHAMGKLTMKLTMRRMVKPRAQIKNKQQSRVEYSIVLDIS